MGSSDTLRVVALLALSAILSSCSLQSQTRTIISGARTQYGLPAIGVAVIKDGKLVACEAVGFTRRSGRVKVTTASKWHLGSCGKAMTVALLATLVDEGKLSWDTTLAEVFPEWKDSMNTEFKKVTLRHLLAHRGGLRRSSPSTIEFRHLYEQEGDLMLRRKNYVSKALQDTPHVSPLKTYHYSNMGFVIAAYIAEKITGQHFEDLLTQRMFEPLGMSSAGFGGQNAGAGELEPMPHLVHDGHLVSLDGGKSSDNPDVISAAGRMHMSLLDWAKFVQFQMGILDSLGVVKPRTLNELTSTEDDWSYSWGWNFVKREWANGYVLTHGGTNTMNYASAWVAPTIDFAILLVSNAPYAGEAVSEAYKKLLPLWMDGVEARVGN